MRIKLRVNLDEIPEPSPDDPILLDTGEDVPQPYLMDIGDVTMEWRMKKGNDAIYGMLMKETENEGKNGIA